MRRSIEIDDAVAARADELSTLDSTAVAALEAAVRPEPGFDERIAKGIRRRLETFETASAVVDMLSVGLDVARLLTEPGNPPAVESREDDV